MEDAIGTKPRHSHATRMDKRPNRLINEKSPYLLQHAYNPVEWFPWCDEAFAKAAREDRPVFLSVGYSACHWCHVMEKESFEDTDVAAMLNSFFVPVKVDREERPDVDRVYMDACAAMTGQGGWPLTVFLTPDGKPFFAGTYFPPDDRNGMIGLKSVLAGVMNLWRARRADAETAAIEISRHLATRNDYEGDEVPGPEVFDAAFGQLAAIYDELHGGFGGPGPKFPQAHQLTFLLHYWKRSGEPRALSMVEKTLTEIIRGGIYDHIGGGVHRYSTDNRWLVPHFEKMLYDQALLSRALLEARQAAGNEEFAAAARDIFSYVLRDMSSPDGAFYSTEDADSEGEEGKFYVWSAEQVGQILAPELSESFCNAFGITESGNFEGGMSVLHIANGTADAKKILRDCRETLFAARETRVRPSLDDKIITAWNGLMISSLAAGAQILGEPQWAEAAAKAARFILGNMRDANGRLLRIYRSGEAATQGFLDDYAFFLLGLIELYQATFETEWLAQAASIADDMLELFGGPDGELSFSYGRGRELAAPASDAHDGAEPAGNSVAAIALLRLGAITGNNKYEEAAAGILRAFSTRLIRAPFSLTQMLIALDFALDPGPEVIISGSLERPEAREILDLVRGYYLPNKTIVARSGGNHDEGLGRLIPRMAEIPAGEAPAARICRNRACLPPASNLNEIKSFLET